MLTFSLICRSFSFLSRLFSRLLSFCSSATDLDLSWPVPFSLSLRCSLLEPPSSLLSLSLLSLSLRAFFSFSSASPLDLKERIWEKNKICLESEVKAGDVKFKWKSSANLQQNVSSLILEKKKLCSHLFTKAYLLYLNCYFHPQRGLCDCAVWYLSHIGGCNVCSTVTPMAMWTYQIT